MSEKIKVKSGTAADIIAGLDIDDETIERAKKYVDKVKHINDIDIDYDTANAPCGFCSGPMPCNCETPEGFAEWLDSDMEARNDVDMPHEDDK